MIRSLGSPKAIYALIFGQLTELEDVIFCND